MAACNVLPDNTILPEDELVAVKTLRDLNHVRRITLASTDCKDAEDDFLIQVPESELKVDDVEETKELDLDSWQQFSGFLMKLSPSFSRGWQKRWVDLWRDKFMYFRDNTCVHRGIIKLEDVLSIRKVNATDFDIEHNGKRGTYHWRCDNEDSCTRWVSKLTNNWKLVKEALSTGTNRFSSLPFEPEDIKTLISNAEFMTAGETGDIVLFRSKQTAGAIVRKATNGEVDHIGLIFRPKNRSKSIKLFEALGAHGVQVFSWRNFEQESWHDQYSRIIRRKLYIPDSKLKKEVMRGLYKFLQTVVNRKYSWNPLKQLRKDSILPLSDPNRTFFCSELVAKAFKETNLLRPNCASSRYLPTTFEERKGLTLLNGAFFGPEQTIYFPSKSKDERSMAKTGESFTNA